MKKFGFSEIIVNMGIFDFSVIVIYGNQDNVQKYVNWKFEDENFSVVESQRGYEPRGQTFFCKGYVPIIWLPRKPKSPREYGTLSHECLHSIYHLFDWADVPMDRSTEEVAAHAMGHMVTEILEKIK